MAVSLRNGGTGIVRTGVHLDSVVRVVYHIPLSLLKKRKGLETK